MCIRDRSNGSDLVFKTSIVWGWQFFETKKVFLFFDLVALKNIVIASAAAVASSNRDALAMGKSVELEIKV